ncbi:TraR/DksA C4-type zinc finger protein [Pseudonocardia sp. ICBG1034]|uniref:TraR/DksA family transcriptional regulator n=1 Tax=Pseudonocardia sp. ICBG1034 TaxID=2844381 RepID=UPI001CCAEC27|nr:TraR/DksA C4-type zinc finger protein [Pseudonocardia sp. ICBG1034]
MDAQRARTLLTEELDQLEDSSAVTERPAPGDDRVGEGLDFGDEGSRAYETMAHDLDENTRRARTARVRAALTRLDKGEHGRCDVCGEQIDDERLEARPDTDRCRDHPEDAAQMAGPVEG